MRMRTNLPAEAEAAAVPAEAEVPAEVPLRLLRMQIQVLRLLYG